MPRAFSRERRSPHAFRRRRTRSGGGRVRHRRPGCARPRVRARAMQRAATRPLSSAPAWVRYGAGLGLTGAGFGARLVGIKLPDAAATDPRDARFRGRRVAGQCVLPRAARVVPAHRTSAARARARRPARGPRRPEGGVRRAAALRRARADELPPHQPGRAGARVRDRGRQPGRRRPQLPPRRRREPRVAEPGRPQCVRGGREPRGHAGQGRVPQRADRAAPVRATDRGGARDPAARVPALDQPLLHRRPRAREEPGRVGGAAWSHRVRDQLPQSRRVDARPHLRRLPAARPACRPSTSRGRSARARP